MKKRIIFLVLCLMLGVFGVARNSWELKAAGKEVPFLHAEMLPKRQYFMGENVTIRVRLTKRDMSPLVGRKITVALNDENKFRKTIITGSDGWGETTIKLDNNVESSCCVPGNRSKYAVAIVFQGDPQFARQELTPILQILKNDAKPFVEIWGSVANNGVVSGSRLVVDNVSMKKAGSGESVSVGIMACIDNMYCTSGSGRIELDVNKLEYGSHLLTLSYSDANYLPGATNMGIFVAGGQPKKELPINGLYKGWDWRNSDPNSDAEFKDVYGNPLSFDGTDIYYWKEIMGKLDTIASKIVNNQIKISLPDGSRRLKRYVVGISPLAFGSPPCDVSPFTGQRRYDSIPICSTCSLPDFSDNRWRELYRDQLFAIADWWKNHPNYQDVITAIRVGGGYDGEWGNGPAKPGYADCAINDLVAFYKNKLNNPNFSYDSFKSSIWAGLEREVIGYMKEASLRSETNGKRLLFIFESKPNGSARSGDPMIGYKFNAVDTNGVGIALDSVWLEDGLGYYRHFFPDHFGALETRDGLGGVGYWDALMGLEAEPNFFDFHGNFWEFYRQQPEFNMIMQRHLGKECDETDHGFIVFRENATAYRKEAAPNNNRSDTENYNMGGFVMNYGDVDVCLYSTNAGGTRFEPVRGDSNLLSANARSQYYMNGNTNFAARRLVSQYNYLDIDDGVASRYGTKWLVRVVYYDGNSSERDSFSIDYHTAGGGETFKLIRKGGTGLFKEERFVIEDLRTDNPFKEAWADLRLNNRNDGADIFHLVEVTAVEGGVPTLWPTLIPSPTPNGPTSTPTPRPTWIPGPTGVVNNCSGGCYGNPTNCQTNCGRPCATLSSSQVVEMCGWPADTIAFRCCESGSNCASCNGGLPKTQGNADCDGNIDLSDFGIWRAEYMDYKSYPREKTDWKADFNCDKRVNLMDFMIWKERYLNR